MYAYLLCTSVLAIWRCVTAGTAFAALGTVPWHERIFAFAPSSLQTRASVSHQPACITVHLTLHELHLPAEHRCTDYWGDCLCRKQRARLCCSDYRWSCRILHLSWTLHCTCPSPPAHMYGHCWIYTPQASCAINLSSSLAATSPCCTLQKGFTQISKAKAENRTCSAQLCLLSGGTSPHPPLQVNTQDVNQCIQIQQRASKGAFKSKQCSEFACLLEVKCMYSLCTM